MIETLRAYAAALAAQDWTALESVLHPDVVYEVPQTRERVRGREAYVRFNREFPGDWTLRLVDAYADETGGVVRVSVEAGGDLVTGIAFVRCSPDGLVTQVSDYWPEPYAPPPDRAHLVERY
jgi:ketosteroid isomerase-like protein